MHRAGRASVLGVLLACAAGALMLAAPQEPPPVAAPSSAATPAPRAAAAPATSTASPVIISSPSADAYVSGVTMLRVAIDSSVAAKAVQFFVDGRQFCSVTEAPFECEWDAGSTVSAHLIRVVVTPENGDRIVRNLRTKGIGYADRVNVEAIQVTMPDDLLRGCLGPRSACSKTASLNRLPTSRPRMCRSN